LREVLNPDSHLYLYDLDDSTLDFILELPYDELDKYVSALISRFYGDLSDKEPKDITELRHSYKASFATEKPIFSVDEEPQIEVEVEKEPSVFDKVTNPAMENLDKKEARQASEQLVDTVLDGYEMTHQFLQKIASIDEGKIQENVIAGKIDLSIKVPIAEDGTSVNALEYVQVHNETIKENISYDPSFGEKVRPAMIRVFSKKGWGLTDEQFLLGAFAKDLAVKATMIYSLKKQGNQIIKHFVQASQNQMQQPRPEVYEPDTVERPQPKEKQTPKMRVEEVEEVEISAEDIENELEN
jgi:hypothetical protein